MAGIVTSYDGERIRTIQGPYPSPTDAHLDAERILGAERFKAPAPAPHCGRPPMPAAPGRLSPADHPSYPNGASQRHRRCRGRWSE